MNSIKLPPNNQDAEVSVLGAILIDKEAISTVSAVLNHTDFYNPINGIIFDSMLTLYEERQPIDLVTLAAQLKKNKKNKEVQSSYLSELVNNVPTAANIEYYAKLIREASTKR